MYRSQSLPMNMKKLNNGKSFKRMNSLGGVYRVVPSTPSVPVTSSNVIPDIVPSEPGVYRPISVIYNIVSPQINMVCWLYREILQSSRYHTSF